MFKDQLNFDPTDAGTIADSDSVGAWIRAGTDGALIDSQLINSQEWLNTAAILHDSTGAVIDDANPLPVDIKSSINVAVDLVHTDDSVRLGDGTNFLTSTTVGADIGLDVNIINTELVVADLANTAALSTAKNATTTQSALLASSLANRKFLLIQNLGNRRIFLAESGATDASTTGIQLSPGSLLELRLGSAVSLDVKSSGGAQDVRVLELA